MTGIKPSLNVTSLVRLMPPDLAWLTQTLAGFYLQVFDRLVRVVWRAHVVVLGDLAPIFLDEVS